MSENYVIDIFEFNDEKEEFFELELVEDLPLFKLLDSDSILLFIDSKHKIIWHWIGINTSIRMRFISGYKALILRDKVAFAFRVITEDEGHESSNFRIVMGLENELDYTEEEITPQYQETEEDRILFDELSLHKILLILKKTELPEGYERKMVIINGDIFYYREYEDSLGIKTEKLFSLKEQVEDGPYLMEELIPRVLFSNNRILLVELLQKSLQQLMPSFTQEEPQVNLQEIMKRLEETKIPAGFKRELIIIGNQVYSIVEKVQQLFGEKRITNEFLEIRTIPEGIFFSENYSPRILSENGKIIAIELMIRSGKTKSRNGEDSDYFPYPYIFNPPSPPGDLELSGQAQIKPEYTDDKISPKTTYCKHCDAILPNGALVCPACGKKI